MRIASINVVENIKTISLQNLQLFSIITHYRDFYLIEKKIINLDVKKILQRFQKISHLYIK